MSRHLAQPLLLPILLLVILLGAQPCQATVEKEGDYHQQGLGQVQEHKDSGGVDHGHLKDVDGGGGGHGGVTEGAGVHSEAGHHAEVSQHWTLTSLRRPEDALQCSSLSVFPDPEFVNGSSNGSSSPIAQFLKPKHLGDQWKDARI